MSDTACREKFGHTEFTAVVDVVISEFVTFFNPDDEHKTPDTKHANEDQ
jgi:hypothetical protein